MSRSVYLDYAAATPMDEKVFEAMKPFFSEKFYNPSATYLRAKDVSASISESRSIIANWLGCRPMEVIFTAGGTEANNLAINGVMNANPESNLIVSAIEHESVLEPAKKYDCKIAPVKADGIIDLLALEKLIDDKTSLVSVMYANNEIGTIEPLAQVSKIIDAVREKRLKSGNKLPIYLHSDACQVPSYLNLQVSRLGVDLMTLNSGKIYGPKQTGALYIRRGVNIEAQVIGGGQEMAMRSGTENVANIVGFSTAFDAAQKTRETESKRMQDLQNTFFGELEAKIKNLKINGSRKNRLVNNINITIPGEDNELMIMKLDELGIQCAAGSACSADSGNVSATLLAIGLTEAEARSSLRFTMGKQTTKQDVVHAVDCIAKII